MFINDLSTNGYLVNGVRGVGWLEKDYPYEEGRVPVEFISKLRSQVIGAYEPVRFCGLHSCSLSPNGRQKQQGNNLLIPTIMHNPAKSAPTDFKSLASANFATRAYEKARSSRLPPF